MLLGIQLIDKVLVYSYNHIPKSKPTPVEVFMDKIAQIESDGNYKVVNRYGMLGKYQFSPTTIKGLGFNISKTMFLNNTHTQDTVMLAYMRVNYKNLKTLIERYEGKKINGVRISRATVLAGAHFAGSEGMRNYLVSNGTAATTDGNGTTITKYMTHFNDVSLPPLTIQED